MSAPAEKIAKLLSLAKDRAGTPEGELAQRLAEEISFRHGVACVEGVCESAEEESSRKATPGCPYLLASADVPVTWATMLLDGLCVTMFGGSVSTVYGWPGSEEAWLLYAIPDRDTDVETLEEFFDLCCYEVCRLVGSSGVQEPARSKAFGVVYGLLVQLWWSVYLEIPVGTMVNGNYPSPGDIHAWEEGVLLSRTHLKLFGR